MRCMKVVLPDPGDSFVVSIHGADYEGVVRLLLNGCQSILTSHADADDGDGGRHVCRGLSP